MGGGGGGQAPTPRGAQEIQEIQEVQERPCGAMGEALDKHPSLQFPKQRPACANTPSICSKSAQSAVSHSGRPACDSTPQIGTNRRNRRFPPAAKAGEEKEKGRGTGLSWKMVGVHGLEPWTQ